MAIARIILIGLLLQTSGTTATATAPLPVNHEFERSCMACVQQNPSDLLDPTIESIQMYSFFQQDCVRIDNITQPAEQIQCSPLDRCCFGIECCVVDGCRSPNDVFYYETQETGDYSQQCDTCCDHIQRAPKVQDEDGDEDGDAVQVAVPEFYFPIADVSQLFGDCNSVSTSDTGESCQMNIQYAGQSISLDVQMANREQTGITAEISAMSIPMSEDKNELPWINQMHVTNDGTYLEGLDTESFGPNPATCSEVQTYAMHQHELLLEQKVTNQGRDGADLNITLVPQFLDMEGKQCNAYGKSLLYYAARQWLNFTEVVVPPTIGTDGVFMYPTESLADAPPFVQLCQTRTFTDRQSVDLDSTLVLSQADRGAQEGDSDTWFNTIVQEECVSTYAYPPSCPKCAMCTKHDELSTRQLIQTYDQVEDDQFCTKDVCEDILGQQLGFVSEDEDESQMTSMTHFVEDDPSVCSFNIKADSCECFCKRMQVLLVRCPHVKDVFASQPKEKESASTTFQETGSGNGDLSAGSGDLSAGTSLRMPMFRNMFAATATSVVFLVALLF
jgi:hypothetical protein